MPNDTGRVPVRREGQTGRGVLEGSWAPLSSLREEIDQLFDQFSSGWLFDPFGRRRRSASRLYRPAAVEWMNRVPAIDVVDKEKEMQLRAELPGMDENDIDVRLSDGALTISGEKKEEREEGEEEGSYYVSERRYGAFRRSIPIPDGIDHNNVEARFRKGVLTIYLPKTAEAQEKSKKIEVKSEK